VDELRQAYQLDPVSPVIAAGYAESLARDGRIQESVDLAKRVEAQNPDNARVQMGLARVYGIAGRYDDELAAAEHMIAAEGNKINAAMHKAIALAHLGRLDDARGLIEDNVPGADVLTISSVLVARAYAALNDRDRAIEWLTKACDTHDPAAWRLKRFPEFDALEGDPRYQALLRRMNFPE
jgi:serine/threonine-protein kinase